MNAVTTQPHHAEPHRPGNAAAGRRSWPRALARVLLSEQPRVRRQLHYWALSGLVYLLCSMLLWRQVDAGTAARGPALALSWLSASGLAVFFALTRFSSRLELDVGRLAVLQALFAICCDVGLYVITGPVRGAWLMLLLVVIVFGTASMRPRQILLVCASAVGMLGLTIGALIRLDPADHPVALEAMHLALSCVSLLAVSVLTARMSTLRARLKRQKQELLTTMTAIRTLSTQDELTSLTNRRHMNEVLSAEERRACPHGQTQCIALLDIDHFKSVNDRHGHAAGDAVLRAFAAGARAELRAGDVLARWGGEEFLLMLPDTCRAEAERVLERMACRVGALRLDGFEHALRITFSGGLVERAGAEPFAVTILRADRAMYCAKSAGRDRVVTA
jgi:diguanylate cyclase (GGDEF)-like protein